MNTPNEQADEELLRKILANNGVYDGKTSLYFQEDVDDFVVALQGFISQHTKAAERLARIDELEIMCAAAISETVFTFTENHKAKRLAALSAQQDGQGEQKGGEA